MSLTTRESLKATRFRIAEIRQIDNHWHTGLTKENPGTFIRLAPPIPELESPFCAVGLKAVLISGVTLPYSLAKRNEDGILILFIPDTHFDVTPSNIWVQFIET